MLLCPSRTSAPLGKSLEAHASLPVCPCLFHQPRTAAAPQKSMLLYPRCPFSTSLYHPREACISFTAAAPCVGEQNLAAIMPYMVVVLLVVPYAQLHGWE